MLKLTLIGGPTAILEYGGVRWLTDPAFSPPGEYAGGLVKTTGPALSPEQVEPIDVVLLSHDHHSDNLDPAGREFLARAGQVLTTVDGAGRLDGNATGLQPWSSAEVCGSDGAAVTVTALPALHGPPGSDPVTGPVIGFALTAPGLETVYISGDNASLDVVRGIAGRCAAVDVAVLFAGAVQLPNRFDGAYLTLSSDLAAQAAIILEAPTVIPLHFEGWTHFTQGADQLRAAFAGHALSDRLLMPTRGVTVSVPERSSTADGDESRPRLLAETGVVAATRTLFGVGVVVRNAEGLVLVGRRRAEPGAPLALPGGKPEAGESVEECAVRELAEETGLMLDVRAVRTFACVLAPADRESWVVAGVEALLDGGAGEIDLRELEPDKFASFQWIEPSRPPEDMFPATAALLESLTAAR